MDFWGILLATFAAIGTIGGGIKAMYEGWKYTQAWKAKHRARRKDGSAYLPEISNDPRVMTRVKEMERDDVEQTADSVLAEARQIAGGDPYILASILLDRGENLILKGKRDGVILLQESIRLMEIIPQDAQKNSQKEHILGRAFNTIAYYYRTMQDYRRAGQEYLRALPHLRRSGNAFAFAHTRKNLAFIYALQGNLIAAEILCEDAQKTFHEHHDQNGVALSLNTLGRINVEGKQPESGKILCEEALKIFKMLDDLRGMGLAHIELGHCSRRLAARTVYADPKPSSFYQEAERSLKQGIQIFTTIGEPLRLVEAYKELGCTYRDWAAQYYQHDNPGEEIKKLETWALDNLQKSHDRATENGMTVERSDTLEDMARVHFKRQDYATTLEYLDRAEALVPSEYRASQSSGQAVVKEPVAPFWSVLGKTNLLRGHIAFDAMRRKESAQWYTLAGVYFDLYAQTTTLTEFAARSIYPRLRALSDDELADWRREARMCEKTYDHATTKLTCVLMDTLGHADI